MKEGHFDYPSLSQDFEWKPHLEMVLIYQVLTRQCLKKVFLTSNDFVPNDSSLLNTVQQQFPSHEEGKLLKPVFEFDERLFCRTLNILIEPWFEHIN